MKFMSLLAASALLAGCCCNKSIEVSLQDISEYPTEDLGETKQSSQYKNHFVACRPQYKKQEKDKIDSITKSAVESNKDIVLYFHGGLSGQDYMVNELGPKLMESMFQEPSIEKKVYPIFVSYDAHPKEHFEGFYDKVTEALKHDAYQRLKEKLMDRLDVSIDKMAGEEFKDDLAIESARLIESFKGENSKQVSNLKSINKGFVDSNQEYYVNLLESKVLPQEFYSTQKGLDSDLYGMASDVIALGAVSKSDLKSLGIDLLDKNKSALRVLRILARFALNSSHGFFATIQEEILEAIKVSDLGARHWNMVKRHAKQCFSEGSNGRAIVDALIKSDRNVHTISHSAGSIPTAELINYISSAEVSFKLKNVVMLVPALNHKVFKEFIVNNKVDNDSHKAFNSLYVYSLSETKEKDDNVLSNWLYSSSLLYAVSSLGEEEITLDQMLLVNQHLDRDRRPYKYSSYLKLACEEPEEIWDYLNLQANNLIYYPFSPTKNQNTVEAATHEGTKYPWVSWDLANDYIEKITGIKHSGNVYKEKTVKHIESQWQGVQ